MTGVLTIGSQNHNLEIYHKKRTQTFFQVKMRGAKAMLHSVSRAAFHVTIVPSISLMSIIKFNCNTNIFKTVRR